MSSRVQLILGPPGTGKTTSLLNIVERSILEGVSPFRIACVTFTKKAAEELVTRASQKFNLSKKNFPHFRTLHSMAFNRLGITRDRVMQTDHFRELGSYVGGFEFKNQYDENVELPPRSGAVGDKCLMLYAVAKATGKPLHTVWMEAQDVEVGWPELQFFSKCLDKYKRQRDVYDFTDFMEVDPAPLDVDVFIIDEAQDLTTQQWNYAKKIAKNARKVYIAGDDDQAIFQWAGADLRQLFKIEGERIVLPHSYRLPRSVFAVADRIAQDIRFRFPKTWTPRDDEGSVNYVSSPDEVDFSSGTWYLLTRNRSQLPGLERIVRAQGFAYTLNGRDSTQEESVRAVVLYERLRSGKTLTLSEARLATRYISFAVVPELVREIAWEDILWEWRTEVRPNWMEAMDRLGTEVRDYIRALRIRGESLSAEPRISLNTIHSVKGGEKENVLLISDIGGKTYNSMQRDPDQENRVWYVGASRASQNLFITTPKTPRFINSLVY